MASAVLGFYLLARSERSANAHTSVKSNGEKADSPVGRESDGGDDGLSTHSVK